MGASAVILAYKNNDNPITSGLEKIAGLPKTDFRIFDKPTLIPYKRIGLVLSYDNINTPIKELVERAKETAKMVVVEG